MRISAHHLKLFERSKPVGEKTLIGGEKARLAARAVDEAGGPHEAPHTRGLEDAKQLRQAGTASLVSLSPDAISAYAQKALETEVGKTIAGAFEEAGVDLPSVVDQDWSPEATAQRIFDFSTSLFDVFKEQHGELGDDELLARFETTLRGAVDRGYNSARGVLDEMSVSDEVTAMGEATMTALHGLFDDYFNARRAADDTGAASPGLPDPAPDS